MAQLSLFLCYFSWTLPLLPVTNDLIEKVPDLTWSNSNLPLVATMSWLAPASKSAIATCSSPRPTASWRAVHPSEFDRFPSAPRPTRSSTIALVLKLAAQ